METKIYRIDKESCQAMIGDKVCCGCGGKLEPLETVDNSDNPTFWAGCPEVCQQFDWGCKEEDFKTARYLVEHLNHVPYNWKNRDDHDWLTSQTRGAISDLYKVKKAMKESAQ